MNTEEKAKAYDEMVQRVKELHEAGNALTKNQMEIVCPELAESEDERIRKWIKKEIADKYVEDGIINNKLADEAFGWLEKQKHIYETTKDKFYLEGFEEGQLYEKRKEPLPIPDKFSGLKSLMLQYLQSAANRKDDSEIEDDTDLYGRRILDYIWKYEEKQKEQSLRDFIDDFPYSDKQKEQKSTECSNEDERIVRIITNLLHTGGYLEEPDRSTVFAWLEKQKEQKSTDTFKAGAKWMIDQLEEIKGMYIDWYCTNDGKEYCRGIKTDHFFEIPKGFYIINKSE